MKVWYIHVTKSRDICSCLLSEDMEAKYIVAKPVKKEDKDEIVEKNTIEYFKGKYIAVNKFDDPYQFCLQCIMKWQGEMLRNEVDEIIIVSDKRKIWQHTKKCEKNHKGLYDYEIQMRSKIKVRIGVAMTRFYCKASRFCKTEYLALGNEKELVTGSEAISVETAR